MKQSTLLYLAAISAVILNSCNPMKEKVDFIMHNAVVYTVDSDFSVASAFAVKDGKFVEVGSNRKILRNYESDNVYNAEGKAVYPGFNDGHCHFYSFGENLVRYADLKGCKSFEEVLQRVEKHQIENPSEWILGRGWDQNLWEKNEFPDNRILDELFPEKKIYLIRIDGHAALASEKVLDIAGISGQTEIEGGDILLDKMGVPTGILIDNACDLVKDYIPELTVDERIKALMSAQSKCFEVGLSSVTDAGLRMDKIELIDSLQQTGKLKMRINAMLDHDEATVNHFLNLGIIEKERLTVRSVKLYADGALGSRGAKLLEPYTDDTLTDGLILHDKDFYMDICRRAYDANYQVNTHCIGDAASRYMLNIYASFLKGKNDRRWRIEHAQVINPEDFKLFGENTVIPSIQSTHCTSDMLWAIERLGVERLKTSYAQQLLLQQNGWIINGTDFPIESINPLLTFYAATIRKNLDGVPENGFQMENALSRKDALRSMTIWPAKGSFEENRKGSIEKGKDVDFVVLSNDIMKADESEILKTKVLQLYILGEKVF